jgi:hypothetical protein
MKRTVLAMMAVVLAVALPHLSRAQEAAHDHGKQTAESQRAAAVELSKARFRFSPELQKMKSLAGRWEGTTFRASEGENPAVMTYTVTGAGSAVVETMFPGTPREMTTIYHDDSKGRLVAEHYCTAANQPKLQLAKSSADRLEFALSPDSDLRADLEGHAHNLTIQFDADGRLVHDWLNHYLGKPAAERNFKLKRVK